MQIHTITKEKAKYVNSTIGIESRLSNEKFVKNAPGHIVVADEQKLKEASWIFEDNDIPKFFNENHKKHKKKLMVFIKIAKKINSIFV